MSATAQALESFLESAAQTASRKRRLLACALIRRGLDLGGEGKVRVAVTAYVEQEERGAEEDAILHQLGERDRLIRGYDRRQLGGRMRSTLQEHLARALSGQDYRRRAEYWLLCMAANSASAVPGEVPPYTLRYLFEDARQLRVCRDHNAYDPDWRDRDVTRYAEAQEAVRQLKLVREIAGDPRRRPPSHPPWLSETAVLIAKGMYESRDFSAMPILADAPQDAGCDSDDILDHCRGTCPHVRGCWVIDLVLGKS